MSQHTKVRVTVSLAADDVAVLDRLAERYEGNRSLALRAMLRSFQPETMEKMGIDGASPIGTAA